MIYTHQQEHFALELVENYGKWDELSQSFKLCIDKVPDLERCKFSELLLCDKKLSNEILSADNPFYTCKILPRLLRYLSNISDKDYEIDFVSSFVSGVTDYLSQLMQAAIDEACDFRTSLYKNGSN